MRRMNQKVETAIARYYTCPDWEHELCRYQFNYGVYFANSNTEAPWKMIWSWNPSVLHDPYLQSAPHKSRGRPKYTSDHILVEFFFGFHFESNDWSRILERCAEAEIDKLRRAYILYHYS